MSTTSLATLIGRRLVFIEPMAALAEKTAMDAEVIPMYTMGMWTY